ncbi:MAG TPA: hypothetical protein DEQ32_04490, partial [Gammaproteobacteria bacterium]|nr:hypothetical protein [Gammaproteobacteria bacterium]
MPLDRLGSAFARRAEGSYYLGYAPMKWRLALLVFLLMSMVCRAEEAPHVRVELISEQASVAPGSTFSLLLRQTIDEGWHTYWRNPGDSGAAPTISWDEPSGVSISPF